MPWAVFPLASPPHQTITDIMAQKRHLFLFLLAIFCILAAAYAGLHWWTIGRFEENTDDAYVTGNLVQLMAQTDGNVQSINADTPELVKQGTTLLTLDETDARLALDKAKAMLAQTVRNVEQHYQATKAADALVQQRRAELARAQGDLARRTTIHDSHAISREDIQHAQDAVITARAQLTNAIRQRDAARAIVAHTTLDTQPDILHAKATLREAWLALQRTHILAPTDAIIAKRSVQVGEHITPRTPLMILVPPTQIWLEANFKENQLQQMRVGQPVSFTTDFYGKNVVFHGEVQGLGAGTGNVFSLLPAQNATGNWIKVVQRLPVRIKLHSDELARRPLQLGLSATATVTVRQYAHQGAPVLNTPANGAALYETHELTQDMTPANQMINNIIRQNRLP